MRSKLLYFKQKFSLQMKVDIKVEDTNTSLVVSRTSFIFPRDSFEATKMQQQFGKRSSQWPGTPKKQAKQFITHISPFKEDIAELKKIVNKLRKESSLPNKAVEEYTDETLDYLKSRETLWKSQSEKRDNAIRQMICEFSSENLARFYEENTLPAADDAEER